jgi:hypothetical protein
MPIDWGEVNAGNRDQNVRSAIGREHLTLVALTLNPSPNSGRGTSILPPFSQYWEKGLGDEGDFQN